MKALNWLKESDRWKHLAGGFCVGALAGSWYCALYAGIGVAGALELKDELKDKAHGGGADPIDFSMTLLGAAIGRAALCWLSWGF